MRLHLLRAVVALLLVGGTARADRNDLTLERIIGMPATPGATIDPTLAQQTQFRSLMSELGVVMSPRMLSPADTLGWSGFQLSFESSFTQISNNADFWKNGVQNVSGSFLPTISLFARKGLWFPLPSFEIGAGGTYLIASEMYALQVYAKWALHEGFHSWPLPSIAVRGAVSHLFGSTQVDMTIASVDVSLSKAIGIAGVVRLEPYLGANALFNIVRSQVIDTTPNVDAFKQGPMGLDLNSNTTFPDEDTIIRWRLFFGFRLTYWHLALTGEYTYTLCNDTGSGCGQDKPAATKPVDRSDGQSQINFSGSVIF